MRQNDNRSRDLGRRIFLWVLLVLMAGVFLFSLWKILNLYHGYREAEKEYENLQMQMGTQVVEETPVQGSFSDIQEEETVGESPSEEEADKETAGETGKETTKGEQTAVVITVPDFSYLQMVNRDVVGWIQIPGTVIDYPIVQGSDNEFYLSHTYSGMENSSGSIFLDALIDDGFGDKNPILHGHNMKNGGMFSQLIRYSKASYWKAHPFVYITTPEKGQMIFEVFSAYEIDAGAPVYRFGFGEDEVFESYLELITSYSVYDAGLSVSKEDEIVTLSTCADDSTKRFLVHGRRIQ